MKPNFTQDLLRRVLDLERVMRELVGKKPLFDIANENTPAQVAADQHNYDTGDYDVLRLSASGAVNFTGFTGGKKGRFLELVNVGSFTITLMREQASSDAANRIQGATATVSIPSQTRRRLYYDSTQERWIA